MTDDPNESLRARPATLADLLQVIRSLNDEGVSYLLIGGYALYTHGYFRTTIDIDLLLPADPQQAERVKRALLVLPDRASGGLQPEWFREGESIRIADEIIVDLLFNAGGETYETLLQYAETADVDGVPVRTLSLQGLLRTKQGVHEKDIADRRVLEAALAELEKR